MAGDHRSHVFISADLIVVATVLFLFFVIGLCRRLEHDGGDADLLAVAQYAVVLGLAIYVVLGGVQLTSVYLVSHTTSDVTKALYAMVYVGGNVTGIPFGIFLLLVAWAALRSQAPRWIGWSAIVAGLAELLVAGSVAQYGAFAATGPVAFLGGNVVIGLWVLAVSVHLLRASSAPSE